MGDIIKRGLGWKPDLPDARDMMFQSAKPLFGLVLPPLVDLRKFCPPVYDQGMLGSCTANALGAAYQFAELKQKVPTEMPSRLFIYYNERVLERTIAIDSGATLRNGIKTIAAQGVAPERLWPYNIKQFTKKPPVSSYTEAMKNRVSRYSRIDGTKLNLLKACLAEGFPFVFGFSVYDYFQSLDMSKSAMLKMPTADETLQGGHAVMAVGYDDSKNAFIIRNSWGPKWGMGGYFYMPYEYITNPRLAMDFWTVRFVTG